MAIGKQESYFRKFPLTNYNGKNAIDIMKRVNLSSDIKKYLSVFYTYTMNREETVDELSFNYYDDVDYDWLIYLANDIIDPHYDTPLTTLDFDKYIVKKYGSIRNASRKIIHYKNNYESDDTILSSAGYEALAPTFNNEPTEDPDSVGNPKKYWSPIINAIGVIGYNRAKENIIYNTNKIMSFSFDSEVSTAFSKGDIIERTGLANGEVVFANTTVCTIKNVSGEFTSNTNYTIQNDSNVTATVDASTVITDRQVIPSVELVYYKPVSYYDYEVELNDSKRDIFLVDKANTRSLSNLLTEVLK